MALTDIGRWFVGDPNIEESAGVSTSTAYELNAAGMMFGIVFQVPKAGTITKIGTRIAAAANPQPLTIGLYTIDSSGNPTTTLYGGSTAGSFTPAANTYAEVTLATGATANAGDMAALVIGPWTGTTGDVFLSNFQSSGYYQQSQYSTRYDGVSTWTRTSQLYNYLVGSIGYSDGTYPRTGVFPIGNTSGGAVLTAPSYTVGTSPNVACRVVGAWHGFNVSSTVSNYNVVLYSGTTALRTQSINAAQLRSAAGNVHEHYFSSPQVLTAGTTYYLSISAQGSSPVYAKLLTLPSIAMAQAHGHAAGWNVSSANRAGAAWTLDTTSIPALGPIIDQVDNGSGSGGVGLSRTFGGSI